jgi:hypothetical protein
MSFVVENGERPVIVCLCGSTRFSQAFQEANFRETLAGRIVLTIGCDTKSDEGLRLSEQDKERLDQLHLHKVELADEVLVLNVGGYIGMSTSREIAHAWRAGKRVRWLEHCMQRDLIPSEPYPGACWPCGVMECRGLARWWWPCDREGMFLCDRHAFASDLQGNGGER